ncbi:MAG: hypothetical protein SOW08_00770 [Lachnospiraceae bacterium]|nr:hypothetical protein [Lachnospiraceae bacterium]
MCRLQKVDFQNICLHERPGGWLAGDFPFDGELYAGAEETGRFLLENPVIMLEMATNLFYYRELGLSMTRMFYIFDKEKQCPLVLSYMNSIFERVSAWYEVDERGRKYLLIQGDGISDICVQIFESLKERGALEPVIQRLYLDSHFCNDVTVSGYYCLEKDQTERISVTKEAQIIDRELVRKLFLHSDFRNFGSINVSGLSMEELMEEPVLKELLELTDKVYLYVFDLCLKQAGEKTRKYVKILRWNVHEEI